MHTEVSALPVSGPAAGRRRTRIVLGLIAVALVAALGWAVWQRTGGAKPPAKTNAPVTRLEFAPADVAVVAQQALASAVPLSGTLVPATQVTLKAAVAGTVRQLRVREGDTVRAGATLLEVDNPDARTRLEAALADQAERRARLAQATRNRDTNRALLQQNFISPNAFEQLHSAYEAAEAAVQWSDAQVRLARKAIDDARVTAPLAAQVARRHVQDGERVSPETPLLTLVDLAQLELEATVAASDVAGLAVGQPVAFRVDGFAERAFAGRIERINPVAEPYSRAIKVFVSVANPDRSLRGGMFATGRLQLAATRTATVIPASAVQEEAGQSFVYTLEQGKVARRAVSLGQRDEAAGLVAVTSGLESGLTVVRVRMPGLKVGIEAQQVAARTAPKPVGAASAANAEPAASATASAPR